MSIARTYRSIPMQVIDPCGVTFCPVVDLKFRGKLFAPSEDQVIPMAKKAGLRYRKIKLQPTPTDPVRLVTFLERK